MHTQSVYLQYSEMSISFHTKNSSDVTIQPCRFRCCNALRLSFLVFVAMITFGILGNWLFQIFISCSRRNLCPAPNGCESMMVRDLVQGISDNCCEQHLYWNSHFSKIYRKIIISHAKPEMTGGAPCISGNGRAELLRKIKKYTCKN